MSRNISIKTAIQEAFNEEFNRNPNLVVLGEDVLDTQRKPILSTLKEEFPDRVINSLPLVEEMLCGIGLGMYLGGLKPVIQFDYSTFITLAMDSIYRLGNWRYRMAEKTGPGIVVRVGHESYTQGGPEFAASLLGLIFHLPNINIAVPRTPYHTKGLLKTALRSNQPTLFFEHRRNYELRGQIPDKEYTVPFGTASVARSGKHITLVAWSWLSILSQQASRILNKRGIEVEIIILHTLHPLDIDTIIASAKKTGRMLIVEEDMLRGGIGAEIVAEVAEMFPYCRFYRLAAKNVPIPPVFGDLVVPNLKQIVEACENLCQTPLRTQKFRNFFDKIGRKIRS